MDIRWEKFKKSLNTTNAGLCDLFNISHVTPFTWDTIPNKYLDVIKLIGIIAAKNNVPVSEVFPAYFKYVIPYSSSFSEIKDAVALLGWDRDEFCNQLGVTISTYYRWKGGGLLPWWVFLRIEYECVFRFK